MHYAFVLGYIMEFLSLRVHYFFGKCIMFFIKTFLCIGTGTQFRTICFPTNPGPGCCHASQFVSGIQSGMISLYQVVPFDFWNELDKIFPVIREYATGTLFIEPVQVGATAKENASQYHG